MKILLLAPALILCMVFVLWPVAEMARVSTVRTNYITTERVGIENYVRIMSDGAFLKAARNSLWYMALLPVLIVGTALFVALFVSDMPKRWADATRIVFYVPVLSAGVIIGQVWRWVFHIDGPLNWAAGLLGAEPVSWMSRGVTAIPLVSVVVAAASTGGVVIVLLAAITSIDRSVFDAARIDGASAFQTKLRIVIPAIAPMVATMTLLAMIQAPQVFETIYMLAPYEHSATVGWIIYREAFHMGRHGTAAAMSVVLMVAMVVLSWAKQRIA